MLEADDFRGVFEFRPLEPGYGITIGNALRRVLLSSLEGFAITSVRIEGVDHEFSSLPGVVEDMTDIILKLKQIRFRRQIDCVIEYNGYVSDSAYTFTCGETSSEMQRLLKVTKEALYIGLEKCKAGNRIGDIGHAVQQHCEKNGYSIVRELCGHGVGFKMHESPNVPNYGVPGTGSLLKEGMVIAVEPMVCMGSKNVVFSREDGWTCRTKDGKPAAHFEHTVAIGANGPDILTTFDFIEQQ